MDTELTIDVDDEEDSDALIHLDLRGLVFVLQCGLCVWSILSMIDCPTKKGGHKASTYRQIEQYPDPTRRSYCSGRIRPTAYSGSFYQ